MMDYPKIIGAMPVEGETVVLTFEIDGAHKLYSVRCKDFISQNKGMKIVRKHNCFSKLRIEDCGGAIEWETPDGEAGIAGDVLFRLAKLQAGEVQGGDKLKQWKESICDLKEHEGKVKELCGCVPPFRLFMFPSSKSFQH